MKTRLRLMALGLIMAMTVPAAAETVHRLRIDSTASVVTYSDWIELLPEEETDQFGIPWQRAVYHAGGTLPIDGELRLVLGRAYQSALALESVDVNPGILPEGRPFAVELGAQTLRDGLFPNSSFPDLPPGAICACFTNIDPAAPHVDGSFDGNKLTLDYREQALTISYLNPSVQWVGEAPPAGAEFTDNITYHIEATVVPAPPAVILLLSGLLVLRMRRSPPGG